MQSFFFLVSFLINKSFSYLFWDSFKWLCLQISRDAKYFSSLIQGIVIELLLYTIFKSEKIAQHYY